VDFKGDEKMTKLNEVYKCSVCGNIIEVLHEGIGELVCCGKPMNLMQEKTEEEGNEKHVPIIEKTEKGIKVKVGSIAHPMEEKHWIEWIQVIANEKAYRKYLKSNELPEAEFELQAENIIAREYCNVHGLWKNK
jgi:superoxide reductase